MPPTFAFVLRNRFINQGGGAEKRRGLVQLGNTISGTPELDSIHEYIHVNGTARIIAGGAGSLWALDTSAETTWTQVLTGGDANSPYQSVQMDDKGIFVNGVDRPQFSTDVSAFRELVALTIQGDAQTTASAGDQLLDDAVNDWIGETDAQVNDFLFDATVSAGAIITNVGSSRVTHTEISAGAPGLASGNAAKAGGDRYEIHTLHPNNVITQKSGIFDNVALAAADHTSALGLQVSAVDFGAGLLRVGDYIRNTTRSQVAQVETISGSAVTHTKVCGQTNGDSLIFLKSAMPITRRAHVHYGRAWYIDARDGQIRISGPGDPQDMNTDAGTLDSTTFRFGDQQPQGETIKDITSFQQYLALGGQRNVLLYTGIDPIADASGDATDLAPAALFPQGISSPNSLLTIGNDLVFMTPDGAQTASLPGASILPSRENLSEAVKETMRRELSATTRPAPVTSPTPRRRCGWPRWSGTWGGSPCRR